MSEFPSASDSPSTDFSSSNTINRLGDEANRAAREFESRDQQPGDSLRGGEGVKREASRLAGDLKDRARGFAEGRKAAGADRLTSVASAVERAAGDLEGEAPQVARYVRDAAEGLRGFSSKLRDRSVDDIATDARDFARRQPLAVFGGALIAGLAISRFLKAGRDRNDGKL